MITKVKDLCGCFKALIAIGAVNLYTSETATNRGFMMHIPNTNFRYVNCPCCGAKLREIEVDVKDFKKLIK